MPDIIEHTNFKYNSIKFELTDVNDKNFKETLSLAEHRIFTHLFLNSGSLSSKAQLEEAGWGGKPVSSSSLSVLLYTLRKKLTHFGLEIKNVSREGYVLIIEELEQGDDTEKFSSDMVPKPELKLSNNNIGRPIAFLLSYLIILVLILTYLTLSAPFECENYGKSYYCYIGNPTIEAKSALFELKEEEVFIYTTPNMTEINYEQL